MDNVRRKHLSFRKTRIKMLVSDQVAETCDACDRTEELRVLRFSIYADFYSDTPLYNFFIKKYRTGLSDV